jgi:predicted nucleic acid-binding protein
LKAEGKKKIVKEMKPKIKLIEEKSTMIVEDQVKAVVNMAASNVRPVSKKNSTFYKKI